MNEHYINLESLIVGLKDINVVLDAGSGKTSLNFLVNKFPNGKIDAIVYPGDSRKIESIKSNVNGNYNLIEMDLCKKHILNTYDLVMAHLLLGEAAKFKNDFYDLFNRLMNIKSKYYVIYDFKEDNSVDCNYLEKYLFNNNFKIINKSEFKKEEPQDFGNFIGSTYIGYLIERIY